MLAEALTSPPETITFTVGAAPSGFEPLPYVLAALILIACALVAWRRGRLVPAGSRPNRWERVAISSLAFAVAMAILMTAENLDEEQSIALTWGGAILGSFLFALVAMIPIGMIDLVASRARPSRSRRWLILAPSAFAAVFVVLFLAVNFAMGLAFIDGLNWDVLQLIAISAGAGLIWWSYLPARPSGVGHVFE
jgi:hypothetical protein